MSGVKVVRYLLANDATLTATVAANKIKPGDIPLNTPMPAIGLGEISVMERNTVAMNGADVLTTSRVQVTAMASTYDEVKTILDLCRLALPNTNGTINGVTVDSILPDITGPDFKDDAALIYMQTKDFIVKFLAAT